MIAITRCRLSGHWRDQRYTRSAAGYAGAHAAARLRASQSVGVLWSETGVVQARRRVRRRWNFSAFLTSIKHSLLTRPMLHTDIVGQGGGNMSRSKSIPQKGCERSVLLADFAIPSDDRSIASIISAHVLAL